MTERTRVALTLATSTGGVGQHVRSLARGLVDAGLAVRVCGPAATERVFAFTEVGAAFSPVEIAANPHPVRDLRAVAALRRATAGAHVVHAHGLRAGVVAALGRRRPLVVTWHNLLTGSGPRHQVLAGLERMAARAADVTLAASEDLATRASALGARDVRFAPVSAPPLPGAARSPAEVRAELGVDSRPLLLSVGRLHPQKRYDVLVDAAARWTAEQSPPLVVVAGSGPDEGRLRARAEAAGAPVRFLGRRDDVADLLGACDLAVVTSEWEARQLFAQEALRAGKPLVATAVGGLPGMLADGAVLVPAGDVDAFDREVRALLADPAKATGLACRGREVAAAWPDEADTVAQVVALYAELTGRRG